jgi:endogenous inhibitor of DNA gyrase (YacG/DUF329 family)
MIEQIKNIFGKKTVNCFYCYQTVDKKTASSIKLNTAEGPVIFMACPTCANDVNDVLKAIEEVKNDSTY